MRLLHSVLLALVVSSIAFGQSYTISTIAGGGPSLNISGTLASLGLAPSSIAADRAGNLFFVDQNRILRLDATTGILTLVAGNGTAGFSGDNGPATSAQLDTSFETSLTVDSAGNVYIADGNNNRIRKVSNGLIATVAGSGTAGFSGDNGPATSAQLHEPYGIAVDSAGNLYIADTGNQRIRKVSNGVITTVAGGGTQVSANGPATSALLLSPNGVVVDPAGNLYIADNGSLLVRKVANGTITTVAGTGRAGFSGDNGPATSAQLTNPNGIAVDSADNLYIADTFNSRIRKVANGVITTVAGNGTQGFSGDNGPATHAELYAPWAVAVDSAGNIYIADTSNQRIRKVSGGVITTVAGGGAQVDDNGPATGAQLLSPYGVGVDSTGNLFIADTSNNRIRKVDGGVITTVAGNGAVGFGGFSGDNGAATSAQLYYPGGVAVDSAGSLYIADGANNRIRKVANGVITTLAGTGTPGYSGDGGPATSAQLNAPSGVAVDSVGDVYIADTTNSRIRKVSGGSITTVAGHGGNVYGGDYNGPATSAQLYLPTGVAVDSVGNFYIVDTDNARIRKVSDGVISTVAGNGSYGFSGDNGPATSAQLQATGVAVDSAGNLYIADNGNNRIRKVSGGLITTVAGDGTQGFSGDNGPAASAELNGPASIAVDSAGNLYVADTLNNRIRLLQPQPSINPGGTVNAASSAPGSPIAPGSIATVYGTFLINSLSTASTTPLPINLAGLSLQFGGGLSAPLFAVSGAQINFQVPWELAGASQASLSAPSTARPV
jgi:sugar lactone lactonase YvrE